MSLKIHAFPPSPRAFKVLAVANHLGLDYELKLCDLTKGDQRQPDYALLNPNMKMPTLEDGDFSLWESNAISQYLASKAPQSGLLPADERARADVSRWQFWESTTWDPACATLMFENFVKGVFGLGAPDPARVQEGETKFAAAASILDAHLEGRGYVCGNKLTLADFALGADLSAAALAKLPVAPFANIARWYAQLEQLPAWRKTRALQAPQVAA